MFLFEREARSANWGLNNVHRHALTSSQHWSGKVLCTVRVTQATDGRGVITGSSPRALVALKWIG